MSRAAVAPAGGWRFFNRMLGTINDNVEIWRFAVRTLPDRQLEAELAELRAGSRPGDVGAVELVAEIYGAEARRRGLR